MLMKLLKYEFIATSRIYVFIYCILAALTGLFAISAGVSSFCVNTVAVIGLAVPVILLALLFVSSFFIIIITSILRFRNNVLGTEGYITHTLPVRTENIVLSNAIAASLWAVATYIIMGICVIILAFIAVLPEVNSINLPEAVNKVLGSPDVLLSFSRELGQYILFGYSWFLKALITVYASMAFGYSFNSFKKIISLAFFVVISYALSLIENPISQHVQDASLPSIALNLAIAAVMLTVASYFLKKRLNLQ